MLSELPSQVAEAWPPDKWCDLHVVVAVSGGADSVALLRALATIKQQAGGVGKLVVAHYNHRWRGETSDQDARWVANLAELLGFESLVSSSPHQGNRSEDQLRTERRAFYKQVAGEVGARYLATGHTSSDQAETVLFRVLRGSGLSGLSGIAPFAHLTEATTLARPLLNFSRQHLIDYLHSIDQPWREDPTNLELGPTRNWIRHELLPSIDSRIPASDAALRRLSEQAREIKEVVLTSASELLDKAQIGTYANSIKLNCEQLQGSLPLIAREAVRLAWQHRQWPEQAMTATHWQTILSLTDQGSHAKRISLPGGVNASRADNELVLERVPS